VAPPTTWWSNVPSEETLRKVGLVKLLVSKEGKTVREACKLAGLPVRTYYHAWKQLKAKAEAAEERSALDEPSRSTVGQVLKLMLRAMASDLWQRRSDWPDQLLWACLDEMSFYEELVSIDKEFAFELIRDYEPHEVMREKWRKLIPPKEQEALREAWLELLAEHYPEELEEILAEKS